MLWGGFNGLGWLEVVLCGLGGSRGSGGLGGLGGLGWFGVVWVAWDGVVVVGGLG